MEPGSRVVVIGASAGGVESLKQVVCGLPPHFPAPVFVVLHVAPYQPSSLPELLTRGGPLEAVHPDDGAKIKRGVVYVAPPDHHLLIDDGRIAIKKGPKENRFRPSIDALFRSAAYNYGPRAIGVILSGALDDGTSGLWSIKRLGGIAVVQQPGDARVSWMPKSALRHVEADHVLPAKDIGALLARLVAQPAVPRPSGDAALEERLATEIEIASEDGAFGKGIMGLGTLTPFTCPECHGALVKLDEGNLVRFRCHTGHGYTSSALLEGVMESTGEMLWQVMRSLEEGVMVLEAMGRDLEGAGETEQAKVVLAKARDLEKRSKTFHDVVLRHESLSGDNLE